MPWRCGAAASEEEEIEMKRRRSESDRVREERGIRQAEKRRGEKGREEFIITPLSWFF